MSMETVGLCCKTTGNPCGTDAWKLGDQTGVCGCETCKCWIRTQPNYPRPTKQQLEELKLQSRREFWQSLLTAINEAPEDAVKIVTRQLQVVEFDGERLARGLRPLSQKERQQLYIAEAKPSVDAETPTESARRRVPVQSWVKK